MMASLIIAFLFSILLGIGTSVYGFWCILHPRQAFRQILHMGAHRLSRDPDEYEDVPWLGVCWGIFVLLFGLMTAAPLAVATAMDILSFASRS